VKALPADGRPLGGAGGGGNVCGGGVVVFEQGSLGATAE